MITKMIVGIFVLDLILNVILFLMRIYERKQDRDISELIKDIRKDDARKYKKEHENND